MIAWIKARLPAPLKARLRRFRTAARLAVLRFFASNGFLASLYYWLCSRRFRREHLAVLEGRIRYYENSGHGGRSSPLLRRNTHRVEKGLIMKPRRPVFAEGFILETVHAFNRARSTGTHSDEELTWAGDVLDEYFEVVSDTPVIRQARNVYYTGARGDAVPAEGERRTKSKPYPRSESPASAISFEDLFGLFVRRRSVRWYLDKTVSAELLRSAVDAAAQAPSACNRQPFRFIVTTEPASASRIAQCAGGTAGFSHQFPAIVVVVGNLSAYPLERDRHLIYIDAALASMQLMLAAETLGLATCPINWPDVDEAEKRIRKILKLPLHERVIMLIAIGYGDPASGVPYSQKKRSDMLVDEFPPK